MIDFTRLYKMDVVKLADIIFTLELCKIDAIKDAEKMEIIFDQAGAPKEGRKIAAYDRIEDLQTIIECLGGAKLANNKEKPKSAN